MITAYVQATSGPSIRLWIGIFGIAKPQKPVVQLNGQRADYREIEKLRPIRDSMENAAGERVNHRTIVEIDNLQPDTQYAVNVICGSETYGLTTRTFPERLPQNLQGTFNILLCSCYSQPEDGAGLLGGVVSQIMLRPHLTLMLGDQIYGDLPISENLPGDEAGVARKIGAKYVQNWTSSHLGVGGLERVLTRAPVLCVADDHEYWNNFPYTQTQLPTTWTSDGRKRWTNAAKALYEDYQLAAPAGGTQRIDIDILKILVVDMRSERDENFQELVPNSTVDEMKQWAADLIAEKNAGNTAFGLLCSGQALFAAPAEESQRTKIDAELGNYTQFNAEIMPLLDSLADEGIPVIYITGDVHWGRVSQRLNRLTGVPVMYEVICSPSRMIRTPGKDALNEFKAQAGAWFGKAHPWPRHSDAAPVPDPWGSNRFRLECDVKSKWGHAQRGDHVAIMSLWRAGAGIDFNVTYYAIADDKALAKSVTTRTYELRTI